jgi:hypothetical protein
MLENFIESGQLEGFLSGIIISLSDKIFYI